MAEFDISRKIKQLREKLGLSQTDFAGLLEIKQQTLSGYERGVMSPSVDVIINISSKCNVSTDWLCGLTDKENYNEKIETYADMLTLVIKLSNIHIFLSEWQVLYEDNSDINDLGRTGLNFAILRTADDTVADFFKDWEKMYDLYNAGTIDNHLYSLWLSDKLKQYQNIPLVPPIAEDEDMLDENSPF